MTSPPRDRSADANPLISVAQAATLLGVHPNTVRSWTAAGRLTAFRINPRGDRRYRRPDVERLLAEGDGAGGTSGPDGDIADPRLQLAVLARLTRGAVTSNVGAACRVAVETLRTEMRCARVAIYLRRGGTLRLATHAGYDSAPAAVLDASLAGMGANGGETTGPDPNGGDANRADAGVGLELHSGGRSLGLLLIEDPPAGLVREQHRSFLSTVANAVASMINSARLLAGARRELTRARALRSVAQELAGTLDLATVLDDIVNRTRTLFRADKVGLWLLEDEPHPFHIAASRGISPEFAAAARRLTLKSPSMGVRAVLERRTILFHDADTHPATGAMRGAFAREGIKTICLVPLVAQDRTLGLIGIYHVRDHDWPDDEVRLAESFSNQAAVAISNARLYRAAADQAARMRSIHDLSARLNRLTDTRAIAEAIVAEATTLAAYHDIRVYTVDWGSRTCEPVAYTRRLLGDGDFRERLRVAVGEGSFTGWVAEHGEPLLVNDALADGRGHTIEGTDEIEESMLVVPMLFEGRALGVLALSKLGTNQFSQDDLQTMMIFAGYAAQAMANASSYARLERQSAQLARQLDLQRRLLEINQRLLSTLDQKDVLETIADGLGAVVHYDNLSIYRADHANQVLVPVLTRERHAEQVSRYIIPFGRGLMGWVVDHGEPVLSNDALHDPRALQIPGTPPDPEALVVVPLVSEGVITGAMNVSRIGTEEVYFSETDFDLVKLFAGQASIALRNADTHHAVSLRAETDALTGLGNHGAFQRTLAQLVGEAQAATDDPDRRLALLMMDLDRFKAYNDRFGHPAGDALLHAVGTAIYGAARSDDQVYRYGGDEFALVLLGVDAVGAASVAERVRRAVARLTAAEPAPVTITIGVASLPDDAADKNELIAAADTALYYGKQAGEDRVALAGDVPREMRELRGTLDELARAALLHAEDGSAVEQLVEQAVRLTSANLDDEHEAARHALLTMARLLDGHDAESRERAERVRQLAVALARRLGCAPDQVRSIELAARLTGVAAHGGTLDAIPSLRGVEELLRRQERTASPIGPAPLAADVLAAATAYDLLITGTQAQARRGRSAAIVEMRDQATRPFNPVVLDALAELVAARPHRGQRRRRADLEEVSGAA